MKIRPSPAVARAIVLAGLLALTILTTVRGTIRAQSPDFPQWVNFFSENSTFLGQSVPVGATVRALNPQGVQCGEFVVHTAGQYGLMPCFRDDPTTDKVDGASPGDVISFEINGLPATPEPKSLNGTPVAPSTVITWTQFGDLWEVDLHVVATPTSTATPTPALRPVGGYGTPLSWFDLLRPWVVLALGLVVATALATVLSRRLT